VLVHTGTWSVQNPKTNFYHVVHYSDCLLNKENIICTYIYLSILANPCYERQTIVCVISKCWAMNFYYRIINRSISITLKNQHIFWKEGSNESRENRAKCVLIMIMIVNENWNKSLPCHLLPSCYQLSTLKVVVSITSIDLKYTTILIRLLKI
jgi:hypothetical protein